MKKIKIMAAAMMLCAAGYMGYTAYESATMTDQERFMLKNIEALANNEVVTISCKPYAELTCVFEIVNAEGTSGTITISEHIRIN